MKPVLKGALALMMVVSAAGCDRVQKAARDLAGEDGDSGRPPASAGKPAPAHVSSAASSSSAVALVDPPEAQVGEWHIAMTAACAAGKAEHMAHYDVNGDGIPDTVCWRTIRSRTYGDFVEVDARVKTGDREQSAYILLPSKPGQRIALCDAAHATVKQALWSQAAQKELDLDSDHRVSITLDDGDCDPVWLFWPKGASGDEVDFEFVRR